MQSVSGLGFQEVIFLLRTGQQSGHNVQSFPGAISCRWNTSEYQVCIQNITLMNFGTICSCYEYAIEGLVQYCIACGSQALYCLARACRPFLSFVAQLLDLENVPLKVKFFSTDLPRTAFQLIFRIFDLHSLSRSEFATTLSGSPTFSEVIPH